jgi:hypothetical protein
MHPVAIHWPLAKPNRNADHEAGDQQDRKYPEDPCIMVDGHFSYLGHLNHELVIRFGCTHTALTTGVIRPPPNDWPFCTRPIDGSGAIVVCSAECPELTVPLNLTAGAAASS